MPNHLSALKMRINSAVSELPESFDAGIDVGKNLHISRMVSSFLQEAQELLDRREISSTNLKEVLGEVQDVLHTKGIPIAWKVDELMRKISSHRKRGGIFGEAESKRLKTEHDLPPLLDSYDLTNVDKEATYEALMGLCGQQDLILQDCQNIIRWTGGRAEPIAYFAKFMGAPTGLKLYEKGISLFTRYERNGQKEVLEAIKDLCSESDELESVVNALQALVRVDVKEALNVIENYKKFIEDEECPGKFFRMFSKSILEFNSLEKREHIVEKVKTVNQYFFSATGKKLRIENIRMCLHALNKHEQSADVVIDFFSKDSKRLERGYNEDDFIAFFFPVPTAVFPTGRLAENLKMLEGHLEETFSLWEIGCCLSVFQMPPEDIPINLLSPQVSKDDAIAIVGISKGLKEQKFSKEEAEEFISTVLTKVPEDLRGISSIVNSLSTAFNNSTDTWSKEKIGPFFVGIVEIAENNRSLYQLLFKLIDDSYPVERLVFVIEMMKSYPQDNARQLFSLGSYLVGNDGILEDLKKVIDSLAKINEDSREIIYSSLRVLSLQNSNLDQMLIFEAVASLVELYPSNANCKKIMQAFSFLLGTKSSNANQIEYVCQFIKHAPLATSYGLGIRLANMRVDPSVLEGADFIRTFGNCTLAQVDGILDVMENFYLTFPEKMSHSRTLAKIHAPLCQAIIKESLPLIGENADIEDIMRIWLAMSLIPRQCLPGLGSAVQRLQGEEKLDRKGIVEELACMPSADRERVVNAVEQHIDVVHNAFYEVNLVEALIRGLAFLIRQEATSEDIKTALSWINDSHTAKDAESILVGHALIVQTGTKNLRIKKMKEEPAKDFLEIVIRQISAGMGDVNVFLGVIKSVKAAKRLSILCDLEQEIGSIKDLGIDDTIDALYTMFYKEIQRMIVDPELVGQLRAFIHFLNVNKILFEIEENEELTAEITVVESRLQQAVISSFYSIYEINYEVEEKRQQPIDFTAVYAEVYGEAYLVNIEKMVEGKEERKAVSYQELRAQYPDVNQESLKNFFQNFIDRVAGLSKKAKNKLKRELAPYAQSDEALDIESIINWHKDGCTKPGQLLPYYLGQSEEDQAPASILTQEAYALVQNIASKSTVLLPGESLTERERVMLGLSFVVQECRSGQEEGIHVAYRDLTNNTQQSSERYLVADKVEEFVQLVVQVEAAKAQGLLSREDPVYTEILPTSALNQFVHQARYIKNILRDDLRLEHEFEFDEYAGCVDGILRQASHADLLEAVTGPLVEEIASALKKEVDKRLLLMEAGDKKSTALYNTINRYLENDASSIYDCDDNGHIVFRQEGAMELLKAGEYIRVFSSDKGESDGEEEPKMDET